jgi:probable lipoprotein NlpC
MIEAGGKMRKTAVVLCLFALAMPIFGSSVEVLGESRLRIVEMARSYLGTPYRYAGAGRSGVDCSGLVHTVYDQVTGVQLPRTVDGLTRAGAEVDGPLAPGDLVFFDTTGGPSHVGIVVEGKQFIHAASAGPRTGVIISSLEESYYAERYLGARSVIDDEPVQVAIVVDEDPVSRSLERSVPPGLPFEFTLANAAGSERRVFVAARHNGQEVFRRMVLIDGAELALWFIPHSGQWTLLITTEASKEIVELTFRAGGRS